MGYAYNIAIQLESDLVACLTRMRMKEKRESKFRCDDVIRNAIAQNPNPNLDEHMRSCLDFYLNPPCKINYVFANAWACIIEGNHVATDNVSCERIDYLSNSKFEQYPTCYAVIDNSAFSFTMQYGKRLATFGLKGTGTEGIEPNFKKMGQIFGVKDWSVIEEVWNRDLSGVEVALELEKILHVPFYVPPTSEGCTLLFEGYREQVYQIPTDDIRNSYFTYRWADHYPKVAQEDITKNFGVVYLLKDAGVEDAASQIKTYFDRNDEICTVTDMPGCYEVKASNIEALSAGEIAQQLSKEFHLKALGFAAYDDLFATLTAIVDGKVVTQGSWGEEHIKADFRLLKEMFSANEIMEKLIKAKSVKKVVQSIKQGFDTLTLP